MILRVKKPKIEDISIDEFNILFQMIRLNRYDELLIVHSINKIKHIFVIYNIGLSKVFNWQNFRKDHKFLTTETDLLEDLFLL